MKPKVKTLPTIRISAHTQEQMTHALKKLNKQSIVEVTIQDFRRLAYLYLSKHILSDKNLDLKLER